MGSLWAALSWWVAGRRQIQTSRIFFDPPCTGDSYLHWALQCEGRSILMIVPPCRPLLSPLLSPAAVSFLFVSSVDHPLCPSLPGFHQSERDDSESDSALPVRCGNEGGEQSVCVPWPCALPKMVQSRGKQTAFGNFFGARKHLCVLCMWGALENE